ncbi:hypothetical protein BpHYR1_010613 [Brachionus plicatilis]|uniref:Uncharacterized protein n=1 Tax=Brachionus plicatilis TaxID=10195 RepID=A0A3M7S735_BRAPC|nr:hypothetical protein BpHYR1_010613 [Brachionus plicatilis]
MVLNDQNFFKYFNFKCFFCRMEELVINHKTILINALEWFKNLKEESVINHETMLYFQKTMFLEEYFNDKFFFPTEE